MKFTGVLAEIGNKTRGTLSLDDAASEVKSINKKQVRIILIICNSFGQTTVLNLFKNWIDVNSVSVFRFCSATGQDWRSDCVMLQIQQTPCIAQKTIRRAYFFPTVFLPKNRRAARESDILVFY